MRAVTTLQLNTQSDMAYQMDEPDYKLEVRQQPIYARVAIGKEKGKTTVDKLLGASDWY